MRAINLKPGLETIVDDQDYERFGGMKWYAARVRQVAERYYAQRIIDQTVKPTTLYLHRCILDAPPEMTVDHINGNGLDNRRCNLRLATRGQNNANRAAPNKTGYRGVYRDFNQFKARICGRGTGLYLGAFSTAEEAARAYDAEALKRYGQFARLNFPEGIKP